MSGYEVLLTRAHHGFNGETFWAQARAGAIPPKRESDTLVVMTAQPTLRSRSDAFYALSEWRTSDLGNTWIGPVDHADTLGRRQKNPETVVGICDMTPGWHAKSGVFLPTGHTVRYADNLHPLVARGRETAYSAYDAHTHTWSSWRTFTRCAGRYYRSLRNDACGYVCAGDGGMARE